MKLIVERIEKIPCMSWCVVMNKNSDDIRLLCGNKVECSDYAFVEGVLDGAFARTAFYPFLV